MFLLTNFQISALFYLNLKNQQLIKQISEEGQTNFFALRQSEIIKYFLYLLRTWTTLECSLNYSITSAYYNKIKSMALPFALIIPGQPLITGFECTNGIYHIDIPEPKAIANISIFLTELIPQNYTISLFFSLPPYNQMQYLGAVANSRPSDTFSTGFPFKTEFQRINTVKLCIQPQSFEQVTTLVKCSDGQKQYSKLVAHNLYNFMMSFHNENILANNYYQGREYLVVPTDTFTRWMKKIDQKQQKDPNFILKTTIQ